MGVIVYILLSGCMPFAGSEQHQIVCIMSGMYDMEDEDSGNGNGVHLFFFSGPILLGQTQTSELSDKPQF